MREGWQTATLAEKIPEAVLRQDAGLIRRALDGDARGLHVDWQFSLRQGWLEVRVKGEDAEAFLNLLGEKFGRAPVESSQVQKWDVLKGFITASGRVGFGVYADLGLFEPARKDALYPLHRMRAQLADGVAKPCRDILVENALVDYFPLKVQVTEIDGDKLSVELADQTREMFLSWRKLPFDRVLAIGVGMEHVERVVRSAGLQYDVIKVEPLSLAVQSLLCKMGTDAPGIISKIGGRLRGVGLASFRAPVRSREKPAAKPHAQ